MLCILMTFHLFLDMYKTTLQYLHSPVSHLLLLYNLLDRGAAALQLSATLCSSSMVKA